MSPLHFEHSPMSATSTAAPANNLANLILALLAPMFLWSTAGDIRLAYKAAAETVNEYRIANRLSLMTVAKIIAFDIATLSSLSLSLYEGVDMVLALRLRGNANNLDRSAERARRLLEQQSRPGAAEEPVEAAIAEAQRMVSEAKARMRAATAVAETRPGAAPVAEPAAAAPAPAPQPAPIPAVQTAADRQQAAWANAMTAVAEEFTAGLKDLPAGEQWKEMARIKALTTAAGDLASGASPFPVAAAEQTGGTARGATGQT
jgi:hypothetical protein